MKITRTNILSRLFYFTDSLKGVEKKRKSFINLICICLIMREECLWKQLFDHQLKFHFVSHNFISVVWARSFRGHFHIAILPICMINTCTRKLSSVMAFAIEDWVHLHFAEYFSCGEWRIAVKGECWWCYSREEKKREKVRGEFAKRNWSKITCSNWSWLSCQYSIPSYIASLCAGSLLCALESVLLILYLHKHKILKSEARHKKLCGIFLMVWEYTV